jgi:hypothetical protein
MNEFGIRNSEFGVLSPPTDEFMGGGVGIQNSEFRIQNSAWAVGW